MSWPEKLEILCGIYGARAWARGPAALDEAEMALFCIPPFRAEMTGGCFWAFFHNSSGDFVPETLAASHRIGAHTSASLLSRAARIYFGGRPVPRDVHERRRLLGEGDGDRTAEAGRVSHAYYEVDEPPLGDLLLAYARANETRLGLAEDEAATAGPLDGDWRQCTACWDAWEQPRAEQLAWCPACRALTLLRDARPPGVA